MNLVKIHVCESKLLHSYIAVYKQGSYVCGYAYKVDTYVPELSYIAMYVTSYNPTTH